MFFDKGGRHYWFSKYLLENEYEPIIFCASTLHNSDKNLLSRNEKYTIDEVEKIKFVFVKAADYLSNGISRIKNMISFFINLFTVTMAIGDSQGKPDIIIASSVHPLTCVAGIVISKKYKVPCIVEIRDLWPESFVAYGFVSKKNPLLKLLYLGEKWIYKKADKLIFTMEGGREYLIEKRWDIAHGGPIDLDKVYHINNGVDLDTFNYNKENYQFCDPDLDDSSTYKVVYSGSIRTANNVQIIVDAAKEIRNRGYKDIKIIVYGNGDKLEDLKRYAFDNHIDNIVFKGRVEKVYIPFILSKCNLNLLDLAQNEIFRFGISPNKLFDYFASGKPTLSLLHYKDLVEKYQCGATIKSLDIAAIADCIIDVYNMSGEQLRQIADNSVQASKRYDFRELTSELIRLF